MCPFVREYVCMYVWMDIDKPVIISCELQMMELEIGGAVFNVRVTYVW